jgi:hypothetical protein
MCMYTCYSVYYCSKCMSVLEVSIIVHRCTNIQLHADVFVVSTAASPL